MDGQLFMVSVLNSLVEVERRAVEMISAPVSSILILVKFNSFVFSPGRFIRQTTAKKIKKAENTDNQLHFELTIYKRLDAKVADGKSA